MPRAYTDSKVPNDPSCRNLSDASLRPVLALGVRHRHAPKERASHATLPFIVEWRHSDQRCFCCGRSTTAAVGMLLRTSHRTPCTPPQQLALLVPPSSGAGGLSRLALVPPCCCTSVRMSIHMSVHSNVRRSALLHVGLVERGTHEAAQRSQDFKPTELVAMCPAECIGRLSTVMPSLVSALGFSKPQHLFPHLF